VLIEKDEAAGKAKEAKLYETARMALRCIDPLDPLQRQRTQLGCGRREKG
jgi:hypothetical protein